MQGEMRRVPWPKRQGKEVGAGAAALRRRVAGLFINCDKFLFARLKGSAMIPSAPAGEAAGPVSSDGRLDVYLPVQRFHGSAGSVPRRCQPRLGVGGVPAPRLRPAMRQMRPGRARDFERRRRPSRSGRRPHPLKQSTAQPFRLILGDEAIAREGRAVCRVIRRFCNI